VRAAEPVYALLRIPDDEECARSRARVDPPDLFLRRRFRCKQEQDLRLDRVRVLELIHEDVAVAAAQLAPGRGTVAQQSGGEQQQVLEEEQAGAPAVGGELVARPPREGEGDGVAVCVPRARDPATFAVGSEEIAE